MEKPYTHEQLAAWRSSYDWTQQEAAARLGLSLRGYQDKEAGKRRINKRDMKLIGYIDRDEEKRKATA